jgi:hypothetical protein
MDTNPNPSSEHHERIDAYAALLSAGHMLSRAILALQFANAEPSGEHRQQALDELYRANDTYINAYAKVYPKGGAR